MTIFFRSFRSVKLVKRILHLLFQIDVIQRLERGGGMGGAYLTVKPTRILLTVYEMDSVSVSPSNLPNMGMNFT